MAAAAKSKWASPAQVNAILRYQPQRQALAELTREAKEQYGSSVESAKSTGRLTTAAVQKAQPQEAAIYDRAQQSTSGAQQQLASVLAGLGSSANPFRAAAATEQAGGADKLARERAATEGNLVEQKTAAAEAPQFAATLANQQLAKSLSKIFATEQGIASGEGETEASEQARIEKEARGEALTKRGQDITAQSDTEGHELTAAGQAQSAQQHAESLKQARYLHDHPTGGAAGTTFKPLSPDKQLEGASTLREIEHEARALRQEGHNRNDILTTLTSAAPPENVPKEALGKDGKLHPLKKANGEPEYEKAPAIKAHDQLLAEAALDSVYGYGRVSRPTLAKLHAAGYSIKSLQLQGPGPQQPVAPRQAQNTAPGSRIAAERKRIAQRRR